MYDVIIDSPPSCFAKAAVPIELCLQIVSVSVQMEMFQINCRDCCTGSCLATDIRRHFP